MKKHPQKYLIEKSHILKKWNFETNDFERKAKSKKDVGYTMSATPYQEPEVAAADLAKDLSYEDLKKYAAAQKDVNALDSKSLGAKEKLKDVLSSLKPVEIHIEHPFNENSYIEAIEDPTEKTAYKTWVTQHSIIYLVLDYMNFIEFKSQLPKQTFLYQKLFGYMSELEVDKVKAGAQILSYHFKTIKLKQQEVMVISE